MLIGQYTSKLTDKDRIAVPSKFRRELGEEIIVAKWYENCLVLVSNEKWAELLKRLAGGSGIVISPVRDVERFVLGSAFEINLDNQGRFVLPNVLHAYAKINKEVVFVGLGDRVEIWDSELWGVLVKKSEMKASEAIEKIARES